MEAFKASGPVVVAFVAAFGVAWLELVTTKYPNSFTVLVKSLRLYLFAVIYGLISATLFFGLDELKAAELVKLEGPFMRSQWFQAVAIGLSTKALLHIRIFAVSNSGGEPFPVGIESLVKIFEPWFLQGIDLDEFQGVRSIVGPRAAEYTLDEARKAFLGNLPNHIKQRSQVVESDLAKCGTSLEVMELYFRLCGRGTFDFAFPPKNPPQSPSTLPAPK